MYPQSPVAPVFSATRPIDLVESDTFTTRLTVTGHDPTDVLLIVAAKEDSCESTSPGFQSAPMTREDDEWIGRVSITDALRQRGEAFYFFCVSFAGSEGSVWRYPTNVGSAFRLDIYPVRLSLATSPEDNDGALTLTPRVSSESALDTTLQMFYQKSSIKPSTPPGETIHMRLPSFLPGQRVDYFVETQLAASGGDTHYWPDGAPWLAIPYMQDVVDQVPTDKMGVVRSLAVTSGHVWIGTEAAGLFRIGITDEEIGAVEQWNAGYRLPSSEVTQLAADRATERLFVGTSRGAIYIQAENTSDGSLNHSENPYLVPLREATAGSENVPDKVIHDRQRLEACRPGFDPFGAADVVAVSSTDGSALFQVQGDPELGTASSWWRFDRGCFQKITYPPGIPYWTVASFDAQKGCFVLAGLVESSAEQQGGILEYCNVDEEPSLTHTLRPARELDSLEIVGVLGVTRFPSTEDFALVIEADDFGVPPRFRRFLVRTRPDEERVSLPDEPDPLFFETIYDGEEVTAVVPDESRGRLVVATRGSGLFSLDADGGMSQLLPDEDELRNVTAVALDPSSKDLYFGTEANAFRLRDDDVQPLFSTHSVPLDAVPLDTRTSSDGTFVLLHSPSEGYVEVEKDGNGAWRVARELPGVELARYDQVGSLLLYGSLPTESLAGGLYRQDATRPLVRGRGSLRELSLYEVLLHPSGDVWTASSKTPYPSQQTVVGVFSGGRETTLEFPAEIYEWYAYEDVVWAATQVGVVEFRFDESRERITYRRLSRFVATSLDVRRIGSELEVAAVGREIARWSSSSNEFELLSFDSPELHTFRGVPLDVAIDSDGRWAVLFQDALLLLDEDERYCRLLFGANRCNLPPTAARILFVGPDDAEDLVIGSTQASFRSLDASCRCEALNP